MRTILTNQLRLWFMITLLLCVWAPGAHSAPVAVRFVRGTVHGFVEIRSEDGRVLASGDMVQVVQGGQVTMNLTFHFKDGSIDDETTVFSERRNFQLVTDHHIQKGPTFPQPIDLLIDCRSGKVTVKSTGKDGKEDVKTTQMHLPPDMANGLVSVIAENILPGATGTTASMLVLTPSPRLVTLSFSSSGEGQFIVAGAPGKAIHYEMKIRLGGLVGGVASMIGKQPPNVQIWVVGGKAPTFVREQGQLYADSPMYTIELVSPTWPDSASSGK
jgi:hypothetical protein